ncbi:hypothetical protein MASR2M74_11210 [Paracoccaceae bacterium]
MDKIDRIRGGGTGLTRPAGRAASVLTQEHCRGPAPLGAAGLAALADALGRRRTWFAGATDCRQMRLRTHGSPRAAGRLCACNGFSLAAAAPARAFGCDVADRTWQRAPP